MPLRLEEDHLHVLLGHAPGQRLGAYRLALARPAEDDAVERVVALPVEVVDVRGDLVHGKADVEAGRALLAPHAPHAGKDGRGAAEGVEVAVGHPGRAGRRTEEL